MEITRSIWNLLLYVSGDRFIVTRKIGFEDHRLIALQFILRIGIVGYVLLWQICTMHKYAAFEPVAAYGNLWDGEMANISDSNSHCNNYEYNFGADFTSEEQTISGGLVGINMSCIPFSRERHIIVGSDSFVAVTWEIHTYANGSNQYFFTDSPHKAVMNLIHGFTSSFLESGVINPKTVFTSKSGSLFRSYDTQEIFGPTSMNDLLGLAGVSLDAKNIQPWIRNGDPSASPFYRLSGAVIVMKVTYSNLRQYQFVGSPGAGKPAATVTAELLPNAWGFIGASQTVDEKTRLPVSIRRTGIKVQLIFAGQVGQFDFMELLRRLVEGVIMFGMAAFGTEFIARWLIYRGSYDSLTSEHLHWSKLRAIVKLRTMAARVHDFSAARAAVARNHHAAGAADAPDRACDVPASAAIPPSPAMSDLPPAGGRRTSVAEDTAVEEFSGDAQQPLQPTHQA